ncbi:MerR family transcriptional regulator [Clostridium sp. SHJSY1]|uniref:MerR family transcriptional regulator n=1 Tax=Clostridium sp. SHJSY1 TaxID=2942483 RepID=UPI002876AEFF|nr:MerR family transcriptional regulator [Clostridium sp. SHJSY1]MDS0527453.1 MerR family transcriptional regulator [Clostridium sp. SHJSY1]
MYTMKETCEKTGMTYEKLKYYCNEGLVPDIKRNKNGHRIFNDRNVAWINSLSCLKNCGMGIQEMKVYLGLCLEGQSSIPDRKVILDSKKEELLASIEKLNQAVAYIDWKQGFYNDVTSGKTPYVSNLISVDD